MNEHYLIYLANDWDAVFFCSEKKDGMIDHPISIFNWMLKRGIFYRFEVKEEFDMAAALLSALSIPSICFPAPEALVILFVRFHFPNFRRLLFLKGFQL